jgi:serine/threonine protein kinase
MEPPERPNLELVTTCQAGDPVDAAPLDPPGGAAGLPRVEVDILAVNRQRQLLITKMFGGESKPTRLGRYVIHEELGRGGMGVVYKAHDPELNRHVAIKLITKDDAKMRDRFRREAQAIAKVKHPNVIDVYDTHVDENGRPFIVMEYVDGTNLKDWIQASPREISDIFKTFAAAGRGLAVVHDEGIVHHDFKPENVLIGKDGRVRVADFGLAKASDEMFNILDSNRNDDAFKYDITQTGALLGTVPYMAPELLIRGGARGNIRTDQFAFCVSLYEALAGERLFQGKDFPKLRDAILRCEVKPLPRAKKIPRRVEAAIRKGLSARPEDRHASMKELTNLLTQVSKRPKRRRWFASAAVVFTGVLAIVGAYVSIKAILDNSSTLTDLERGPGTIAHERWARRIKAEFEPPEQPVEGPEPVEDRSLPPVGSPEDKEGPEPELPPTEPEKPKAKQPKPTIVEVKLHAGDFDSAMFDFGPQGERTVSTAETIELPRTKIEVKCREYDAGNPRGWMPQTLDLRTGKRTIKCLKEIGPRLQ